MNAVTERQCSGCGEIGRAPGSRYCKPCLSLYGKAWRAAKAAGVPVGEWRPWINPSLVEMQALLQQQDLDAGQLADQAVRLLFEARGYAGMSKLLEDAKVKLSKRNRWALANEGWIA